MSGLLRGMARTAVVAGTATAVSKRVSRRQGQRWAQQQYNPQQYGQQAAAPQYAAPAPHYEAPAASSADLIAELQQLADLRASGVLTDEEFAAEKRRILSS
ncbi:SHOCT domain-containing protein [Gordonia sp. L191]|uniref:SHOCT domain-containing protein n=1 Tax=Gordonia sp. L191 TaxID=2982699 RepID=UPI0024BF88A7|nr:SHOCT domain-containing protein [Gordonia sp. L191]WHU46342.1 SHOCT domain-containing protein [Gordonia sp. L191]